MGGPGRAQAQWQLIAICVALGCSPLPLGDPVAPSPPGAGLAAPGNGGWPGQDAGAPPGTGGLAFDAATLGVEVASAPLDACTPGQLLVDNQAPGRSGGQIFAAAFPDPVTTLRELALRVCQTLHAVEATVKRVPRVTLVIESPGGSQAAYSRAGNIVLSAAYVRDLRGDVAYEVGGLVAHHLTHVFQYDQGPRWLIEGMADFVRYKLGYYTLADRQPGGRYSGSYRTTGFFIAWLDTEYPDFARKLNLAMRTGADESTFTALTGKPIATLWNEYQSAIQ